MASFIFTMSDGAWKACTSWTGVFRLREHLGAFAWAVLTPGPAVGGGELDTSRGDWSFSCDLLLYSSWT